MKKNKLLSVLLSGLCFLCLLWLTPLLMIFKGRTIINDIDIDVYGWGAFQWFVFLLGVLSYGFFFRGLFFLRKYAKLFYGDYLSQTSIENSNRVGFSFLFSGLFYSSIVVLLWIKDAVVTKEVEIGYDMDLLLPITIITVGVFFMIQADKVSEIKVLKEETQLTI